MPYFYSYIASAKIIIESFSGETPFADFIKKYFALNKKFGSRDRKSITALCYGYFRLGNSLPHKSIEERLLTGLFLFTNTHEHIPQFSGEWNNNIALPIEQKIILANLDVCNIFPFIDELSTGVEVLKFNSSFLIQPDLFIRIRPGKELMVKEKFGFANISYNEIRSNCYAIPNGINLENAIAINDEAVIQDLNSQGVGDMFQLVDLPAKATVWDCCAASGGKSIMAYDFFPSISLTVSDIRQSIIYNLQKRFSEAGIKNYQSFVADIINPVKLKQETGTKKFDFIICDAPCSGSGTWSRTPEQLLFFKKENIARYNILQRNICTNVIEYLKTGGYFLYITCSAFKKENEDVVNFIQSTLHLHLIDQRLLKGYESKADTMFTALFQSN